MPVDEAQHTVMLDLHNFMLMCPAMQQLMLYTNDTHAAVNAIITLIDRHEHYNSKVIIVGAELLSYADMAYLAEEMEPIAKHCEFIMLAAVQLVDTHSGNKGRPFWKGVSPKDIIIDRHIYGHALSDHTYRRSCAFLMPDCDLMTLGTILMASPHPTVYTTENMIPFDQAYVQGLVLHDRVWQEQWLDKLYL